MNLALFPAINATLNATTAVLLVFGFILVKRKHIVAHKAAMLTACATSALFLACYLYYHYHHGATHFPGQGITRSIYFTVLISHTILAVVILPLIFKTLFHALRGEFERHRRIARITLPLWSYVSVTGVVVYWMLYRVNY